MTDFEINIANIPEITGADRQQAVGIAILRGAELVIETANDDFAEMVGKTAEVIVGRPLEDVAPAIVAMMQEPDVMHGSKAFKINIDRAETTGLTNGYTCRCFVLPATPQTEGGITLIAERELVKVAHADRDRRYEQLVMQSPVAMAILMGEELVVEIANETLLQKLWRRTAEEVTGKPMLQIFPELREQKFVPLMLEVMRTGMSYKENEALAYIRHEANTAQVYVDLEYAPVHDEQGRVCGVMVTATDVTEKVQARVNAERAEQRLLMAADGSGVASWDLDLLTKHIVYTRKLNEFFGQPAEVQMTHEHMRQQVVPEDLENILLPKFAEAMLDGDYFYEARIIRADGATRWIRTHGKVIYDESREPVRMLGTMMDITDQMAVRNALQESEDRFRRLVKDLPFAVYTINATGQIDFYNDAATALWQREPIVGEDMWCGAEKVYNLEGELIPPEQLHTARVLYEHKSLKGEALIERPGGDLRHVLYNPQPFYDATGKLKGVMNALVDITELKRAQQALQDSEQRFRIVADTAPVMIWMAGPDKVFNFFNRGWLEFTGRTTEQETGNGWLLGVHPDDLARCYELYSFSFDNRKGFHNECRMQRHDGTFRWVRNTGVPRYNVSGTFEGYIGSCIDIHDQKLLSVKMEELVEERTRHLQQAKVSLERSNEELEQFAFVTSHDLQEPLRKIQTFANMLHERNKDQLGGDALRYLEKILGSAQRMSRLINELLNFSRLGRPADQFEKVDLNELLQLVLGDFELLINQKDAIITSRVLPVIDAIPLQMNQLLYNLIGNALKFTVAGRQPRVDITCAPLLAAKATQYSSLKQGLSYYEIVVRDNGIGFKQEYAHKIFEIFQRLHGKAEYEGTGIGLALCSKILTNHQGIIFVNSEEGSGTEFHLLLPKTQV